MYENLTDTSALCRSAKLEGVRHSPDKIKVHKHRGKWCVRVMVLQPGGKPKWPQLGTFQTKREANDFRDTCILGEVSSSMPLSRFAAEVWLPYRAKRLKPSSFESRVWAVKRLTESFGDTALNAITEELIEDIVESWCDEGANTTARTLLKRLRSVLTLAVTKRLLVENHADAVVLPPSDAVERPTWTDDELDAFAAVSDTHRLAAGWNILTSNGPRRSEVLGLEWANVDLEKQIAKVVRTIVLVGGQPIIQEDGKTPKAQRDLHLDGKTCELLKAWRIAQLAEYEALGIPESERTDFVMTSRAGTPLSPRLFARSFDRLCKAAGVRKIHVHDVRHTFAQRVLRLVVSYGDLLALSRMLGHSSVTVTLELYGHAADGEAARLHGAMMAAHRERHGTVTDEDPGADQDAPTAATSTASRRSSVLIRAKRRT